MADTCKDPVSDTADSQSTKKKTVVLGTSFSFKENKVLDLDTYSVAIPDGFAYKERMIYANGSGGERVDLAAWTPDLISEDKWEEGRITINASPKSEDIKHALKDGLEALKECFESLPGVKENSREIDYHKEEDGQYIYCFIRQKINGRCTNFHCIAGKDGNFRQFRIRFNTGVSKEKMERSVIEWLKTVKIKAPSAMDQKEKELAAADNAISEFTKKRDDAAKLLEDAEKAYSKLLSEQLIEEESTKLQIRSLETKIDDKEQYISELKRQRREARVQKDELRKTISNLEPERRAQSNAIAIERKALEDKRSLLTDEKAEIQEEKADKKTKLQGVFLFKKKKQQEYDEVKSRLKEKNSEISECDEEIENLDTKVAELKENTDKERARLNEEISNLDNEEKELRRSITAEEEAIKKIAKEVSILQDKIKDYKQGITNAANELAECRKQYELYDENVSRYEAQREIILKEIKMLEEGESGIQE